MPTFRWEGDEGVATIGHLPAFVRVPYAMPGEPAPWDINTIMDAASIVTLIGSTLIWARYRRRRARSAASPSSPQAPKPSSPQALEPSSPQAPKPSSPRGGPHA